MVFCKEMEEDAREQGLALLHKVPGKLITTEVGPAVCPAMKLSDTVERQGLKKMVPRSADRVKPKRMRVARNLGNICSEKALKLQGFVGSSRQTVC